jgi:hypothetical protein
MRIPPEAQLKDLSGHCMHPPPSEFTSRFGHHVSHLFYAVAVFISLLMGLVALALLIAVLLHVSWVRAGRPRGIAQAVVRSHRD